MSAFLGKIHYWLFNKVEIHERLIEDIASIAEGKGHEVQELLDEGRKRYGHPVVGSLEDEINHSNIHGWLQEQISSVETRLAHASANLMKSGAIDRDEIAGVFKKHGIETIGAMQLEEGSPQIMFTLVFDHMIEGMPCDRASEIVENDENRIVWRNTRDLHKPYWDEVGGDVEDLHYFRSAWIDGFLSQTGFKYFRDEDGVNIIERV